MLDLFDGMGRKAEPLRRCVKYDAVIFDLLTALIDSWTLWNDVAGSPDAGMKWRRRYLEITYGCGPYRPYETLVREAARDVGLPESLGGELERRWGELQPWPEARGVLSDDPRAAGRRHQLLGAAGPAGGRSRRRAVQGRDHGRETRASTSRGPNRIAPCSRLSAPRRERTLFVAGSASDVPGAKGVGMPVYWHNRVGLPPRDDARPDHLEPTLDKLADLFARN